MLEIDGSYLEGGGQILRTSLALSTITNTPIRVFNIRKKRPKPGLKHQHLAVIEGFIRVFGARAENAFLGSEEIIFYPNRKEGRVKEKIDIGSSGSIGLFLQGLIFAILFSPNLEAELEIVGGTFGKWSMPVDYYSYVIFPLLKIKADFNIIRRGYYPKGGGVVILKIKSQNIRPINFVERGSLKKIKILSFASSLLKDKEVAQRQMREAERLIRNKFPNIHIESYFEYKDTYSPGSEIFLCAYFDKTILWVDNLGEKEKPSEKVAEEAVKKILEEIEGEACVDRHLADNLIPYMGMLGGRVKVSCFTDHILTNIFVTEKFLERRFFIDKDKKTIITKE